MTCPSCGLALPDYARFCARCGRPLPAARPGVEAWILVLFAAGVVLTAGVAVLYAAIAMDPAATSSGLDPATVRTGSTVLATALGILCLVQIAAIAGLVRGREWGRVVATVACVLWSATCIGIPVAALVLGALWRRRAQPAATAKPLF